MKRVFLISPEPLYTAVVPELTTRDVVPVLVCASEREEAFADYRRLLPQADVISSFVVLSAELPEIPPRELKSAPIELIEALAPWEGTALQMIDRCNYDGLSVRDLRSFYLRYISLWLALLDRHHPDCVVFHGTPHMGHDYVLYLLCRRYGISTLIVDRTYLDERLYFHRVLEESPAPSAAEIAALRSDAAAKPSTTKHYDKLNRDLNDVSDIERSLSWPVLLRRALSPRLLFSRETFATSVNGLTQRRWTAAELHRRELLDHRRAKKALGYYRRIAAPPVADEPFAFYPLHFEPERTTVPEGGRFSDQADVVLRVVEALPPGWKLYVKEHPRQFRRGVLWNKARTMPFYERLAADPRVRLVPLEVASSELIARCRSVVTITGTAGWEAVQAGRPALAFGHPWYYHCPGVRGVRRGDDCREFFSALADGVLRVDPAETRAFAEALIRHHTFVGCFSDKILKLSRLTPEENGRLLAEALADSIGTDELQPVRSET